MRALEVQPLPLVRKTSNGLRQLVELRTDREIDFSIVSGSKVRLVGPGSTLTYLSPLWEFAENGTHLTARIEVPVSHEHIGSLDVSRGFLIVWESASGETLGQWRENLGSVRPWRIHVVTHSHCDVGFTHPASEVEEIHNKNLDLALAAIRLTQDWPKEARFRWTVETSWQLENYRHSRDNRYVQRLIDEARKGNIEITAAYLHHHFDVMGTSQMHRVTWEAERWRAEGVEVMTAMLADIPGVSWGILPVLKAAGIRYLSMAPNNFSAPFHSFDPPARPFYWVGPGGEKVLVWYTKDPYWAYIEGTRYGLLADATTVAAKLPELLLSLSGQGYEYEDLMLQVAFDNDRLHITPSQIIKDWNETYEWPKFQTSLATEFFRRMESKYGKAFPEVKGDWPSWWVNSTIAYPLESAASRQAHHLLEEAESLAVLAENFNEAYPYPHRKLDKAYTDLMTFDEHSGLKGVWIAFSQEKQGQALAEGTGYLKRPLDVLPQMREEALNSLVEKIPGAEEGQIAVINPTFQPQSGLTVIRSRQPIPELDGDDSWQRIDGQWPFGGPIYDTDGTLILGDPLYLGHAGEIPGGSYGRIAVNKAKGGPVAGSDGVPELPQENALANDFYEITFAEDGLVKRIVDKETGQPLITNAEFPFACVVCYREISSAMELPGGDFQARKDLYEGIPSPGEVVELYSGSDQKLPLEAIADGTQVSGRRKVLRGERLKVTWDVWLYHRVKRIDLAVTIERLKREQSHGRKLYYLALPFAFANPLIRHQVPGGWSEPGYHGQISGSCMDVYAVGDWVRMAEEDEEKSVLISSFDAPLAEYDGIHLTEFLRGQWKPKSGLVMFRLAFAEGDWNYLGTDNNRLVFRFSLTSGKRISDREAHDFAVSVHHPLIGRWLPPKPKVQNAWTQEPGGFLELDSKQVAVTHFFKLDEPGAYVLWLREMAGKDAEVSLSFPRHRVTGLEHCTPAGYSLDEELVERVRSAYRLRFRPYQTMALKAVLIR